MPLQKRLKELKNRNKASGQGRQSNASRDFEHDKTFKVDLTFFLLFPVSHCVNPHSFVFVRFILQVAVNNMSYCEKMHYIILFILSV